MIKDLIRVGPPQGSINDLDLGVPKEFNKEMRDEMRKDFEKELKAEKLEKQDRDSDQVSKKSSGGIKRKMTKTKGDESDVDKPEADIKAEANIQPLAIEEKISKVMVSEEGEVEIADDEKNLPQIAPEQANVSNIQAQILAAQMAVTGEALPENPEQQLVLAPQLQVSAETMPTVEQPLVEQQPELIQPDSFQYLNSTEKELMADIGEAQPSTTKMDMPAAAAMIKPQSQAEPKTNVAAPTLESKVYDILSKENLKPGVEPKLETAPALNQTNAVLAQVSVESEKQQSDSQQDKDSSGEESASQSQPKFDAANDLASQVSALHTGQRSFQSHLGGAIAATNTSRNESTSDVLKDDNVREIMNQAKFLVTKGGGEMSVKMTPEGMGEVQLKVALDNGKINIEMNSQDKAVKKMIEDSLSDLKSSLASHQMRVEHVKINNVTAVENTASTNNQAQFQSDTNSSNSNFHNMANSNSGGRHQQEHGRQSSSYQTVQAPVVKPVVKANAYTAANKGSSINMVA